MNFFSKIATQTLALCLIQATAFGQSVFDIIEASDDHNTLEAALVAAGLDETLSAEGTFTVFAPTDNAFSLVPANVLEDLLANPTGQLTQILLNHVVGSVAMSTDLSDGMIITTIQGSEVEVGISNGVVTIGNATVIVADLEADNGVVHVIDAILMPEDGTGSVFDIIEASDDHNTLEAALVAAGLDETLSAEGTFTVFAPTDNAFSLVPANVLEDLLANPTGQLTQILLNHVVGSVAMSTDLSDGMIITTIQGSEVEVGISNGVVTIGNATVIVADLEADNGVVHVIDAILMPEDGTGSVFDIIEASDDHNTLEAALVAAGLDETLSAEGTFTVFAPTDNAFSLVPANVLEDLLANPTGQLTQILLNHVVGSVAMSTDLSDGMIITTIQGSEVEVGISNGVVTIGNATVIVADLEADNGVVHVIDAILMPEEVNNIFQLAQPQEEKYLYSINLAGQRVDREIKNTIVIDVYNSRKTKNRFAH